MPDWIPRADTEFDTKLNNYVDRIAGDPAAVGLSAADAAQLQTALTAWQDAYGNHHLTQAAAAAARQEKDAARANLTILARNMARRIQANPDVEDSARAAVGITVPDRVRTPSPIPESHPVARVDTAYRLRHRIYFRDSGSSLSRGKPKGVTSCQVWGKFGGDPVADDYRFLGIATRSPYLLEHKGEDAGKIAHYRLRWVNTRGQTGPWGPTASATITG